MKKLIDVLRDPTHPLHQKLLTIFEEALQQRGQEIFNEIEAVSEVIDWEDDLGEMRELKEGTYQSIKAKFTKPKVVTEKSELANDKEVKHELET